MTVACIYHKLTKEMRVVTFAERDRLVGIGEWSKFHPNAKGFKEEETNHEEPIRRRTRKRVSGSELSPEQAGTNAQPDECVRQESAE